MSDLLQISKFAKLANTSRRTLIFYDQIGLFRPQVVKDNGYRLYSYDQLYQISFILGLRKLGLSIAEIMEYLNNPDSSQFRQRLTVLDSKITKQVQELQRVQTILRQQLNKSSALESIAPYQPVVVSLPQTKFWCADYSVDCTVEEIAQIYSAFYAKLNLELVTDRLQSGFKTNLPDLDYQKYATAGFRLIKEQNIAAPADNVPVITKPAGDYLLVKVANNVHDIEHGIRLMKKYSNDHHCQCTGDLWQINIGNQIQTAGFTKEGFLEYQLAAKK